MDREKSIVKVSIVGIVVNLILVAFKAAVGFVTGSIAVILDAVNNLSDALSSVITIIGAKLAGRAPDKKHPYGHGRIEYLSSIVIAIMVLLAGVTSFKESVEKILHPAAANYTTVSLIIIAAAVLTKYFLGRYVSRQGKKLNSQSLIASGADATFDAVLSFSTLVAAAVSLLFHLSIEGYLGVIISVVILKAGIEILMESVGSIIGLRVDSDLAESLKEKVCSFEQVHGAYDLTLHNYGPERIMGSVHIEVDDALTAREIHYLTRKISETVYREFGIILTVGIYAANTDDDEYAVMKEHLSEIIREHPEILQMHGYYADKERHLVTFDLVIGFEADDAQALCNTVTAQMKEAFPAYTFYAVVDSDVSD
ncbi:MAG: cation diffusion facilitator family transporter [Clostridiales bacterium]|nr:cation diffusion facilitator family transporter [Clostridiales bacterium]